MAADRARTPEGGGTPFRHGSALLLAAVLLLHFLPLAWGWHGVPFHLFAPEFTGSSAEGRDLPAALAHLPGDDPTGVILDYPAAYHTALRLRAGEIPWWNPGTGMGRAWAGNAQVLPFSPFLLPFLLHPSPYTYSLQWVLLALASLAAARWFFREAGLEDAPALFGALLWTFNPFTSASAIMSSAWAYWCFPIAAAAALRALNTGSPWAWAASAAGLALTALSGQPETAWMLALIVPLLFLAAGGRGVGSLRAWTGLLLCVLLALLLSAAQWGPVLSTLTEAASYKSEGVLGATALGHPLSSFFDPRGPVFLQPLLWAGALLALSRRPLRWEAGAALAGLFLLLAQSVPLLAGSLPFRLLRLGGLIPPLHASELSVVPLTILAALGLSDLASAGEGSPPPRAWRLCALAVWTGLTAWAVGRLLPLGGPAWAGGLWLAALLLMGAALLLSGPGTTAARGLLAALAVAGALLPLALTEFRYPYFSSSPPPRWTFPAATPAEPGPPARMWAQASPRTGAPFLTPNLNLLTGVADVRSASVFNPPGSRSLAHAYGFAGHLGHLVYGWQKADPALLRFLGVRWAALAAQDREAGLRTVLLEPGPRAFVAGTVRSVLDDEAATKAFVDLLEAGRAHEEAVVLRGPTEASALPAPEVPPSGSARVRWLRYEPHRLSLIVESAAPGFLVVLEAYDGRWRARIDGRPAPLYRTDVMFRGLPVAAGSHRVEMEFDALASQGAVAASALAWLLLGLWAVVRIRRGRVQGASL
jgi:hypothetical protein